MPLDLMSLRAKLGIAAVLIVGAALRLVWPGDMEYKSDEIYSFERTQAFGVSEPWPWTGMNNSADVPHPGMSVWVFLGLAKLFDVHDPIDLNVACMMVNVLALGLLAVFIACIVTPKERELWWWGLSLLAVNPLAVLFHRKIWPPSVLPAIAVIMLATWWYRSRRSMALLFGVIAALAAQIHPGAFFFAAALCGWALIFDYRSFRWPLTVAGGMLGALPALPWAYHLAFVAERSASAKVHWWRLFELKYWVYWFTEPFGLHLKYSLGEDFVPFLQQPMIDGQATYLVGVLHVLLATAFLAICGRYVTKSLQTGSLGLDGSPTGMAIGALGIGYGLLLTITGLPVYRHYLIIAAPVACVALARMAFMTFTAGNARWLLGGLSVTQCAVTVLFLMFVHNIDRPIRGDYGTPYRVQVENKSFAGSTK